MNTNLQYIKKISPLFITLVFIAGIVSAYNYSSPTGSPSENPNNVINVGSVSNTKLGGISVNAFTAMQDANFDSSVTFLGELHGTPNTSGPGTMLRFGGYDELRQKTRVVNVSATGGVQASAGLFSQKITTASGTTPLCAKPSGEVVLCEAPAPVAPVCGNWVLQSGEQCDDGNTTSGDGCSATCAIEPPPVLSDLCPDATNPDPRFAGVQNPLPSDVTIRDGLCKIKISAAVTYSCSAKTSQGAVKYVFSFDRPVPEDMMIYVAHTSSGNYNNCLGFPNSQCSHLAFTTNYYGFQFLPNTYITGTSHGLWINLTKGMSSYSTPFPLLSNQPAESPYQSLMDAQTCTDNMAVEYKTSGSYFKVGNNAPNIYVTDFRSTGAPSNNPGFRIYNQ